MDSTGSPRDAGLVPPSGDAETGDGGLSRLFECGADLGALDRMLLAFAAHREGAGFARVHLLVSGPGRDLLEPRGSAPAIAPGSPLGETLEGARRLARAGAPDAALPRELPIARLEGPLAAAWSGSSVAVGEREEAGASWSHGPALGAIALRRGPRPYGLLIGEWDSLPGPECAARLERVRQVANAALDAEARAHELARRERQVAALAEFARGAVTSINLAEALHLAARLAVQSTRAMGGALWLARHAGEVRLEVTHGATAHRERLGRMLQPLATEVVTSARARVLDGPACVSSPDGALDELGSVALVPLAAYGRALGALAVYDRAAHHPAESGGFDRLDLETLAALADQVALLLEQAHRVEELSRAEQQRRDLTARARHQERLASLGELSARAAREARNPLASIAAFARRAHRTLPPDDAGREYLEIVIREAERLERLVEEQLQHAALDPPRLQMQSLNAVVQECLQESGEALVRRRVRLLKKLAPDLPPLLLDAGRVRRVVANILQYALDAVPIGGRIRVESRRVGAYAVVDLAHDGPRAPGELLEQLFVPFAAARPGVSGVGLGVAQQLVREHGGEIRVRSEGEWSTLFSFTLPISGNQDRRAPTADRRSPRADRRSRFPEG